jgi:hypothetical protein
MEKFKNGLWCLAIPDKRQLLEGRLGKRVVNRYVGNLPPMPGVFPDHPAPVVRNAGDERELVLMRWGHAEPAAVSRLIDKYPQCHFAALASLVGTGKPLSGSIQQLRRICAGAEPRDQKERRGLVCAQR